MFKIAVVGATGNVGRALLQILAERRFPVREIVALASATSKGKEISFGDTDIVKVQALDEYDFTGTDIAFFSPGAEISRQYVPKATAAGCIVIDNSSFFRLDPDVPLIIPEINPERIADYRKKLIIANPNCSTIQMLVALNPLHEVSGIKRVVVATYQSVSGSGKDYMDELFSQTKSILTYQGATPKLFTKQIAFNVIPHIDRFVEDNFTREELKIAQESIKIMGYPIQVAASCVRVPVFIGHSEAVHVEFEDAITPEEAREALHEAPGVHVLDKPINGGYITPIETVGEDNVFVSRIRIDPTVPHGLSMWVVADNIRKGAALNAVQIAEILVNDYLVS